MPLIKDGKLVADPWQVSDDGSDAPLIVDFEAWQANEGGIQQRNTPVGIRLASDQSPTLIADDIERFDVIALEFPKFNDGRAYSYARLLRERYGYKGELRAVGNVLRDQYLFMHRCGFDAFEVADASAAAVWEEALREISVWYQPTADKRQPAADLRRKPSPRRASSGTSTGSGNPPAVACAGYWAY